MSDARTAEKAEKIEFTACGPKARLTRQGVLDLVILYMGAFALFLFGRWALRGTAPLAPGPSWACVAWCAILAMSWALGLTIYSKRYA